MTKPPPANLMEWPKGDLAKEVARLRAILREHGHEVGNVPHSGGDMVDVAGDPHARGGVVLDARKAVLMDAMDVCLVDTKQDEKPIMMMVLEGRVNYETRRTKQAYLFGADGASALATQVVALAGRAGGAFMAEFQETFEQRMAEMPDAPRLPQPSSEKLAQALEATPELKELAARARRDEFHDFVGPHAMPQHTLVAELREVGGPAAESIAQRVIQGEFDATKAESDAWMASPEGQATLAEMERRGEMP
jgi:hypothetical protein